MKKNAHIRKDGSPSYKKEIRINGVRLTKRFTRIADAEKWYSSKRREKELIESGVITGALVRDVTFSDYVKRWLLKRQQEGKPYSSCLTDKQRLEKWVLPEFGSRVLQKISSQEFGQFIDKLVTHQKLAPGTRNRVRAVLHKLYSDAVQEGVAEVNPLARVQLWKENLKAFDYFHSIEECLIYLSHAKAESQAFYTFAALALNAGARLGETLALQNQDIDFDHKRMHISKIKEYTSGKICNRTKAGRGTDRWLGLNDDLLHVLIENKTRSKFKKPNHFIIHTEDGESVSARTIRGMHDRVCKKAGLSEIRIHDLRHTFAGHYVMNGGTLNDLQALLGHSSPFMTQRYAHMAPGYLESKAQIVSIGISGKNIVPFRAVSKT